MLNFIPQKKIQRYNILSFKYVALGYISISIIWGEIGTFALNYIVIDFIKVVNFNLAVSYRSNPTYIPESEHLIK